MRILISSQKRETKQKILHDLAHLYPDLTDQKFQNHIQILNQNSLAIDVIINDTPNTGTNAIHHLWKAETIYLDENEQYFINALDDTKILPFIQAKKSASFRDVFHYALQRIHYNKMIPVKENGSSSKIIFQKNDGMYIIKTADICHLQAWGKYSILHLVDGTRHVLNKNLGDTIKGLEDDLFIRCHKSFVINSIHIVKIINEKEIHTTSGITIPVSRRKLAHLKIILSAMATTYKLEIFTDAGLP